MDEMNQILKDLELISEQRQQIYDHAYKVYTDAVNSMVYVLLPDERQVEQLLDGLLTFCDDKRFTELYKRPCRHIFALYPNLAENNYIQLYHSKYESNESGQTQKKTSKQRSSGGTAHIFLKTDLVNAVPTPIEKMDKMQRQVFEKMNPAEQQKILEGYPASIVNLESGDTVCKFNIENFHMPKHAIESFARRIFPDIQESFLNEEIRKELEEWKRQQGKCGEKSK